MVTFSTTARQLDGTIESDMEFDCYTAPAIDRASDESGESRGWSGDPNLLETRAGGRRALGWNGPSQIPIVITAWETAA